MKYEIAQWICSIEVLLFPFLRQIQWVCLKIRSKLQWVTSIFAVSVCLRKKILTQTRQNYLVQNTSFIRPCLRHNEGEHHIDQHQCYYLKDFQLPRAVCRLQGDLQKLLNEEDYIQYQSNHPPSIHVEAKVSRHLCDQLQLLHEVVSNLKNHFYWNFFFLSIIVFNLSKYLLSWD